MMTGPRLRGYDRWAIEVASNGRVRDFCHSPAGSVKLRRFLLLLRISAPGLRGILWCKDGAGGRLHIYGVSIEPLHAFQRPPHGEQSLNSLRFWIVCDHTLGTFSPAPFEYDVDRLANRNRCDEVEARSRSRGLRTQRRRWIDDNVRLLAPHEDAHPDQKLPKCDLAAQRKICACAA